MTEIGSGTTVVSLPDPKPAIVSPPATAAAVVVPVPGPPGPPGAAGSDIVLYYVHRQEVAAATWVIDHNVLCPTPDVVLEVDGRLVYSDVYYPSQGRVTIVWPEPTSGIARIAI